MPPLVYETVAWLRFYTCVPIPVLPGEGEAAVRAARAVPLAGAIIGWIGGIVLLLVWLVGAPDYVAAAAALFALAVLTAGRSEQALAATAEKLGSGDMSGAGSGFIYYGVIAIVLAVLLRVGALDALVALGAVAAGIALVGAGAVSRSAAVGFALLRPAGETADAGDKYSLQWLVIFALGFGIVTVLPTYGVGATIAGLAAAIGAASLVTAFVPRAASDEDRAFTGTAEIAAEVAFLVAIVAFASAP
jgi:adenosylcobinamide-GDP ribazoletransferase